MRLHHTLLDYTLAYHWPYDVLRLLVIAVGGAIFGMGLMRIVARRLYYWTFKRVMSLIALQVMGLFAALQEYQQLGRPMLWWRLPLLVVFSTCAGVAVFWPSEDADYDWRLSRAKRKTPPAE